MHDFKISPRSHIENPPALRTSRLLVGKRSASNTYGTARTEQRDFLQRIRGPRGSSFQFFIASAMQTPEKKIEPSVQKMVLFLNLRTHGAVPFSFSSFLCRNRCSSTSSHSYIGRQRIEPSVRKMVLFLNLRTHRAVSFSSAFSDEYTTANLSACDRDRQRPFLNVKQNLPYFKKVAHCSTP